MLDGPGLRSVLWDMDGTLLDSTSIVPDAFIRVVEILAPARTPDRESVVALYSVGPPSKMLPELLGRRITSQDLDLYHSELHARAGDIRLYDGIRECLQELHGRVPMGVFTGASRSAATILLEAAGIGDFFSAVVGGDEVDRPKPAPDGLELVCARLGVPVTASAYVGDSPHDSAAATAAGARPFVAGWGHLAGLVEGVRVLDHPREITDLVLAQR